MKTMKSIFRYPGGKFKAIKFIEQFWSQVEHDEYREPFVGGGSVFIAKPLVAHNWINDLDKEIIAFYKIISNEKQREILIKSLLDLPINRKMYEKLYFSRPKDNFNKALRYYVLNRCSFSGITRWNSFIGDVRYNIKNSQHLIRKVSLKLSRVKITNLDFEKVILEKPSGEKGVFLFLDPPYAESRQIVAYNVTFSKNDHLRLAKLLKKTKYSFLLTYDDCKFVRDLYTWANLYSKTWTYSVANSRVHHNPRENGNELFISNYPVNTEQLKLL